MSTGMLSSLKELYLNNNPLNSLPFELALCTKLALMSVEGCPLADIPERDVDGGPSTIMLYLRHNGPFVNSRLTTTAAHQQQQHQ